MNFYSYRYALWYGGGRQSATADAAINYTEHDKRYHHGNFDPKTMTCEMREAEAKGDLVDVLNAEQEEKEYATWVRAKQIIHKTLEELTSRSYTDDDRDMVDGAIRHVLSAKPVEVQIEEAVSEVKSLREQAKYMKDCLIARFKAEFPHGEEVPGLGVVEINKRSARSIISHSPNHNLNFPSLVAICRIKDLLRTAIPFSCVRNWKGRSGDSFCVAAPLRVGDQDKVVEITITRNAAGRSELYNIKVVRKEEVEEGSHLNAATRTTGVKVTSSTTPYSIPNTGGGVNGESAENHGKSFMPRLPASRLVKQYLAAHGLLDQFVQK